MLAERIQRIGFSSTLRINTKANKMRQEGLDVINLSVGEPDFPTPENIKNAAKAALDKNLTRYTPNNGIPELLEAVSNKFREEYGADCTPKNVIISTGAKQSLYNACMALVNRGDEVIIPTPYWVSYPHMVNLAMGRPVFVNTKEENGFRLTSDELGHALSARTKAIILNNPSNPTGSAYSYEDLLKIVDICVDEGVIIIADEIYEKLVYNGFRFHSVTSFGMNVLRNTVAINGFSKAYSMTGWRVGYALAAEEIIQGMSKVQSHSTSNTNSIAQWASVEALTGPQHEISRMLTEFERRRNYILYRLSFIPHISCHQPEGAFYAFANFSWYYDKQFEGMQIRNSAGLAYYLLKHALVALMPGDAFGADNFIRLSYATSMENLEKAMDRIIKAMAELRPTTKARKIALRNTKTKVQKFVKPESSVSLKMRDALVSEAEVAMPYDQYHEWNASIGGVLIKLATNSPHLVDFWAENWYPAPLESDIDPHGIIYGVKDAPGREASVFYSQETRTALMFNTAYYHQLRSTVFGMVDDIASRMFDTFLVSGSCLDIQGSGVLLIGPPGCGIRTHLSWLLRQPEVRLHSMDGFFIRWAGGSPVADSVERKLLIRTDITRHLPELSSLLDRSKLENVITSRDKCEQEACRFGDDCPLDKGEPGCYIASHNSFGLVDPYWIGGTDKHVKRTVINRILLLQHDNFGSKVSQPTADIALRTLEEGSYNPRKGGYRSLPFFNQYVLVRTGDGLEPQRRQWSRLLNHAAIHQVNTEKMSIEESKNAIWKIVSGK